jgi:DNA-binding transcriptional regulator YiaG
LYRLVALLGIAQRTICLPRVGIISRPYHARAAKPQPGTVGFQIRARRLELHMKPSQLALKIGVLTSTIRSWEANRLQPTEDQNDALMSFFAFR